MKKISLPIKGIYRDILTGSDNQVIHDSGWSSNTIVNPCRIMLARFMKEGAQNVTKTEGIYYLVVGQGDESWDCGPEIQLGCDPSDIIDLYQRYDPPIYRDKLQLFYLDEQGKKLPDNCSPTNRLQIEALLEPGYPAPCTPNQTYPLREFGLFGRFKGDQYMINWIRHPVIHKDQSSTLERIVRLEF